MKIALVTDTYHPQVNGVVNSIDTIAEEMEERGNEVSIFAPTETERSHGFRSFPFYLHPDYRIAVARPSTLAELFEKEGIDIVHVHSPFSLGVSAVSASKALSLPKIGTFHTLIPE